MRGLSNFHRAWPPFGKAFLAEILPQMRLEKARLMAISRFLVRLVAVDPFRPGGIYHTSACASVSC